MRKMASMTGMGEMDYRRARRSYFAPAGSGGMPFGLFKGERTFTLTPRSGAVEFAMREVFSGLLSPLI